MRSLVMRTGLLAVVAVLAAAHLTAELDRAVVAQDEVYASPQDRPGQPPVPEPPAQPAPETTGRWLVGDLHVHVSPPDEAGHSALTVASAVAGARRSGLDFVILTPHAADRSVPPGPETGDAPLYGQELVAKLAAEALAAPPRPLPDGSPGRAPSPILVVSGWEYTRVEPGHLGISFVDVGALSSFRGDMKAAKAVSLGGLVVVNHPFFRPVKSDLFVMKYLTGDRRWRPFFDDSSGPDRDWNAIEVWHDRSVLVERMHGDPARAAKFPDTQMVRGALEAWDRRTLGQRRRIAAVGGSDAHGKPPYTVRPKAVVSVYVEDFTVEALQRGLVGARVTFGRDGGPSARDFSATSDVSGRRALIGQSLRAESSVRLTWAGKAVLFEDGVRVGESEGGVTRAISPRGSFHFWRIEKDGESFSNMIYANLP